MYNSVKHTITMNIFYRKTGLATCLAAILGLSGYAQNPNPESGPGKHQATGEYPPPRQVTQKIQRPTFLADYFT